MIESVREYFLLVGSDDPEARQRLRIEPAADDVWMELIRDHPEERAAVALNKSLSLDVLRVLAQDPDPRVRYLVSMKKKLSSDILDIMSTDSDESVRMQVARHKNTSPEVLEVLSEDEWESVRECAFNRLNAAGSSRNQD